MHEGITAVSALAAIEVSLHKLKISSISSGSAGTTVLEDVAQGAISIILYNHRDPLLGLPMVKAIVFGDMLGGLL